jgi:hypothetical protein
MKPTRGDFACCEIDVASRAAGEGELPAKNVATSAKQKADRHDCMEWMLVMGSR